VSARDSVLTAACDPSRVQHDARGETEFIVPAMPTALARLPEWFTYVVDAYGRGELTVDQVRECRRNAATYGDIHRAMADVKKADAQMKAAQAQERMAEVLAAFEHGGPAVAMLARLQEGLSDGTPRALPGRRAS
jgi:hypothetical protein